MTSFHGRLFGTSCAFALATLVAAPVLLQPEQARAADAAAAASSSEAPAISEVVVTARKRSENLQRVPAAVTSQTGAQLEKQGIRQVTDLQHIVPSLQLTQSAAKATSVQFDLRGQFVRDTLATNNSPVGIYEDTVNIPKVDGLQGSFFDLTRVEVVAGPQGTLYGRNTTGGAVNIITNGADYRGVHGFLSAEAGDYKDWKAAGAVNLPIIDDKLAMRLAYQHWNREGYGQSVTTGQRLGQGHDDNIARLSVLFDPAPNLTSTTKVEFSNAAASGYMNKLVALPTGSPAALAVGLQLGGSLATAAATTAAGLAALNADIANTNPYQNQVEQFPAEHVRTWHIVEDATWKINDDVSLRSITGWHDVQSKQCLDLDATQYSIYEITLGPGSCAQNVAPLKAYPYPAPHETSSGSFTQEFDLSGKYADRVDWLIGAFYSHERGSGSEPATGFPFLLNALGGNPNTDNNNIINETTKSWAVFTQDDIHFTQQLSATVGFRYTQERQNDISRQFVFNQAGVFSCDGYLPNGSQPLTPAPLNNPDLCPTSVALGDPSREKANGISYLASLNFQATPDVLFYAKTARGFRGGALQTGVYFEPPVQPEIATDYEIGMKGDFFDHRLRVNMDGYQTNYKNKQEYVVVPTSVPGGVASPLVNAANARIRGFEGEFTALPTEGLTLSGTLTYFKGIYTRFGDANCGTPAETGADKCALNQDSGHIDGTGLDFVNEPRWRYSLSARYEHDAGPGRLAGELDWSWRGAPILNALSVSTKFTLAQYQQYSPSIGLLNARIDYNMPDAGLSIGVFATNLLNKHYEVVSEFAPALGLGTVITQDPRMFGVSIRKSFGGES